MWINPETWPNQLPWNDSMTFELHDERRECVRYRCDFAVKIIDANENEFLTESCDLSEKGICLLIRAEQAGEFINAACQLNFGDTLIIALPDAEGLKQRTLICSVSHSARMPEGHYIVGLYFEDSRDETKDFIVKLISECR